MPFELFHAIGDPDSAAARRAVMERGLKPQVDFRNVHYADHRRAFEDLGGTRLPALWDGERLHQGLAAVVAGLDELAEGGS